MVAFLDVIACGFGAVVLIILIVPVGETSPKIETTIFKKVHSLKEQIFVLETDLALAGVEINARKKNVAQFILLASTTAIDIQGSKQSITKLEADLKRVESESDRLSKELAIKLTSVKVLDADISNFRYGIPVDSEYLAFVIDTSGSMQFVWPQVVENVSAILNEYPRLKGFRILSDEGEFLTKDVSGDWLPPDRNNRDRAVRKLRDWSPYSNSSPVEGIAIATERLFKKNINMAVLVLGDDYPGNDFDNFLANVREIRDRSAGLTNQFRIHAIGFSNEEHSSYPERFSRLMQRLTFENGGAYLHITANKPGRVELSRGRIKPGSD